MIKKGQTIIELVVMIGVIALVVLALVSTSTKSLGVGNSSRLRSVGVKYAQEGIELTRNLRDTSTWSTFQALAGTVSPIVYCLNEAGVWSANSTCSTTPNIASTYTRTVSLQWTAPRLTVISTVSWQDGQSVYDTSLQTNLTQWR